jgi:multidrug efflux pump
MNLSALFIHRPVGTTLLMLAIALAGIVAYRFLPVSPLPQVDYPTISVSAQLPGASPETMASSVATPLEREFGRIAGLNEMTSTSYLGSTSISLQFDLSKNINAAARDVQAAINAARGQLPPNLPNNPTYRKSNPADSAILILSLTSELVDRARLYDLASSILQQKISQADGVGRVFVWGGALPAVRVAVNPTVLNSYGLGLDDVRGALAGANANRPKGEIADGGRAWALSTTDQLLKAAEYQPLIISYKDGRPVRLADVAAVTDSVQDVRNHGLVNGKPAILIAVFRQPGANIIETVDRVRALLPQLQADIPPTINLGVVIDRTTTIRASVHEVQFTLALSIALVVLVVFIFLRSVRTAIIPSIAVPVSLIGTFSVMYLLGYSLNNLSLMALTIATGFVVDDAIVVIENIMRHLERGMRPLEAALRGAREIGFTVVSITISLLAVFIPILLMGGMFGRLFREFAVTLAVAVAVSLVVSLTATPMMCAKLLRGQSDEGRGRLYRASEWMFQWILGRYETTLAWVLRHQPLMLLVTLATIGVSIYLYVVIPKGFFPQQDTGMLIGQIQADQNSSYQAMRERIEQFAKIVGEDPAVANVSAFTGGGQSSVNIGRMFVMLKPLEQRQISADQVLGRLRGKLSRVPGARLVMQVSQDLRVSARQSGAQYQFTLQGDNVRELNEWAPRVMNKIRTLPELTDVNSDQQDKGLEASLVIDRDTASRLGISSAMIDNALYDAFGQRQVSTMYRDLNQYYVVLEVQSQFWQNPEGLKYLYVKGADGGMVPLSGFTHYASSTTPLAVNHQGQFPAVTLSFNLAPGIALGDAVTKIGQAMREMGVPATIRGSFQGMAQAFQESLATQPWLIAAALVTVYLVLGILYESYIHPLTILSTLPSAGVGALLALLICRSWVPAAGITDLNIIALIGIILLIGIVKKNAIMMIDFALEAERSQGKRPVEAIFQACLLRFRPITMTTMAAMLGALPLALGTGIGSELRRPLGIVIVGGLMFSQLLTLYTTPVVYLYLDRLRLWCAQLRQRPKRGDRIESLRNGNGMGGYAAPHHVPTHHMEEVHRP